MVIKDKKLSLDQIKADILANNVCPDLAKTATQLVFGDGNADADIVFIGEAPGKNEDLQGVPFVGAAGKFLDEMLASIDLKRQDVYITNIVKYRPPNNRDPLPEEKEVFLPYLQSQLKVIAPKIVITLGRHSTNCFLPGLQISQVHGQPKRIRIKGREQSAEKDVPTGDQRVDGVQGDTEAWTEPYEKYGEGALEVATQQSTAKHSRVSSLARKQTVLTLVILPLYHPAAALYNGGLRETLLEDFSKIPAILRQIDE